MKQIPLSKGYFALVDNEDFEWLSKYKWFVLTNYTNYKRPSYAGRSGHGSPKIILLHREIMKPPKGLQIDHINGNGLDNRKNNLRICTHTENQRNYKRHRSNKYALGTSFNVNGKYQATIRIRSLKKSKYLGSFKTQKEAHEAFLEADLKYNPETYEEIRNKPPNKD